MHSFYGSDSKLLFSPHHTTMYCKHCQITYGSYIDYSIHGDRTRLRKCYWKDKDQQKEWELLVEQQKMFAEAKLRYLQYLASIK